MSRTIIGSVTEHTFSVDAFSRVEARDAGGGFIVSQTVEALLLLEILDRLPAASSPSPPASERKGKVTAEMREAVSDACHWLYWAADYSVGPKEREAMLAAANDLNAALAQEGERT